eukprot:TRINITY_DN8918_c0_g2_i1.p1 TRINITY_DN8918_c0_g2~~TRINITY_DN8918_c0_g2_i1.p1  ORF type:complete len:285 (+),score=61.74 TRINITY_DN8918_c0_g2_i1:126-857(+)
MVVASAAQVREYHAAQQEAAANEKTAGARNANGDGRPLRHVDPKTGALQVFSSMDTLLEWVPLMEYEKLTAWAKVPVFRVRLYTDRQSYQTGHVSYAEQVFPGGEDLASSICWWRRRMSQASRGFAVFEGGFDEDGPVYRTEPPVLWVDAVNGEVDGDDYEEIERKRIAHFKRKAMDQKWARKGLADDALAKIAAAEALIREKKRRGEAYLLKAGWVQRASLGVDPAAAVARHNDRQKKFSCR